MPRLRPRPKPKPKASAPEMVICMEAFRTGHVGLLFERGQQLPIDHPVVQAHPESFRGLVPLTTEEVTNG